MEIMLDLLSEEESNFIINNKLYSGKKTYRLPNGKCVDCLTMSEKDFDTFFNRVSLNESRMNEATNRSFVVRATSVIFSYASKANTVTERLALISAIISLANMDASVASRLMSYLR